jgi:hypothetical protein
MDWSGVSSVLGGSSGSGSGGGYSASNSAHTADANAIVPTLIIGGIGNSGGQSASVSPRLSATPENTQGGVSNPLGLAPSFWIAIALGVVVVFGGVYLLVRR